MSSLNISLTDIRRESSKSWTQVSQRGATTNKVWIPSYGELYTLASDAIANQRSTYQYPDPNTFKPESSNGYGTVVDYSKVWVPKDFESGHNYIATRSTFIAGGPNVGAMPSCLGLYYDSNASGQTIPEHMSIARTNFGTGYDSFIYFGFCI